jgi:CheY-like chemotaxis protein
MLVKISASWQSMMTHIVTLIQQNYVNMDSKCLAFTDPQMALEHLNANRNDCDLISSDIRMPGMNGYVMNL